MSAVAARSSSHHIQRRFADVDLSRLLMPDMPFELEIFGIGGEDNENAVTKAMGSANMMGVRICRVEEPNAAAVVCVWFCYTDINIALSVGPEPHLWGPLVPPSPLPRPYRVMKSKTPGGGLAMRAARDIERGETIIIERPLLIYPKYSPFGSMEQTVDYLTKALDNLSERDRKRFWSLPNCKGRDSGVIGLMETNNIRAEFPQSEHFPYYHSICPEISRCNHR